MAVRKTMAPRPTNRPSLSTISSSSWIAWTLAVAGVLWLVWFFSPPLHWVWYHIFMLQPTGWVLTIGLLAWIGHALLKDEVPIGRLIVSIVVWLSYAVFSPNYAAYALANNVQVQELKALPDTTGIRYMPKDVAHAFARNEMNDSTVELGPMHPIDINNQLNWVAALVPHGFPNTWTRQTSGIVMIQPEGSTKVTRQAFRFGEGMSVRDDVRWQLFRHRYLMDQTEIYYQINGDEVLTLAPYITYYYSFPVMLPQWGGVFVIHPNGTIEDLNPQQAQADGRFKDQRLYPELLARKIGEAWEYHNGIFNKWWFHRDQAMIPTIADSDNQMPYLLPTTQGPQWFFAFEPVGRTYGVLKVMYLDARTGAVRIYTPSPEATPLIGVNRAASYARTRYNTVNWQNNVAFEPRPIVRKDAIYWMLSVTNSDHASINSTVLVNAGLPTDIRSFCGVSDVQRFLNGTYEGETSGGLCQGSPITAQNAPNNTPINTGVPQVPSNLTQLNDQQLAALLRQVADELDRRRR